MAEKKKRRNYSFSIKKTDSPVIEKFLNAQTNYSESLRYLILKFCRENDIKDISYMLNSYIMFPDEYINVPIRNEQRSVIEEEVKQSTKDEEVVKNNYDNNIKIKEENINELGEDDIPDCYE
ncbi:hypothetical protein [Clostridium butyricum]|uniref:hypothetical protein n=1 Tax=Clostridium butyricum TaxID=1492 RepID=UPI0022E2E4B3|nr:hypothetical protein [Clostridium butyricum]MDU3597549.1 hypothetical protein [Clostridium butyricum]